MLLLIHPVRRKPAQRARAVKVLFIVVFQYLLARCSRVFLNMEATVRWYETGRMFCSISCLSKFSTLFNSVKVAMGVVSVSIFICFLLGFKKFDNILEAVFMVVICGIILLEG